MPLQNQFNLGKDCTVVLIGPFGRVDLQLVTRFHCKQITHNVKVSPLNSPPLQADVPGGWDVTFELDRANSAVDDLMAQIESKFWQDGTLSMEQMYQYINEVNGSVSTYQFINGSIRLPDAGDFSIDKAVKTRVEGFFSQRNRV